jgi:hypothetical protein
MAIECLPLEGEADFREMMGACWEAFENPFASFLRIVFYLKGESPEARAESINEAASNMMALHGMFPSTSHWIKVVDTETGKLIGAANWMTHESSPYIEPRPPTVAVWWPEGDGRDYASSYMQQVEAHKARYYNRPHVCKCVLRAPHSFFTQVEMMLTDPIRSQYIFYRSGMASSWCR